MIIATTEYYQEENAYKILKDKQKMRKVLGQDKYFAEDYWTMEKTEVFDTSLVNTYPVICKPKKGEGSKSIVLIIDISGLKYL